MNFDSSKIFCDGQFEESGLDFMPYKWGKYRVRLTKGDLAKHEKAGGGASKARV